MTEKVTFRLDKLVRDGVLESMLELGQEPDYRQLKPEELEQWLIEKNQEESAELEAGAEDLMDEIDDAFATLVALAKNRGVSVEQLVERWKVTNAKRGGFDKAYYVGDLTLRADDPWTDYYRKYPERFKEVKDSDE